jgi:predicted transposase YdaD
MKHKDILWKGILQDLFEDFLCFFYPRADDTFDFSKGFEFLDKELEQLFPPDDDIFSPRYVDKLIKVFLKEGGEKWMLVHVEVQGYIDENFSKRMFQYYTRIFDKYDRPITAFAIFTDSNKDFHPTQYVDSVLGTEISYTFNTCKIIEQDDAVLAASNNPFAMVILSAKLILSRRQLKDQQLFDSALDLAKLLLTKGIQKDKIRRLIYFMYHYIRFENQEMLTKFGEKIAILTEGSTAMGIEELVRDLVKKEGIEEGIEKRTREITINGLKNRMDMNLIANITGLSVEEIKNIAKENHLSY